MGLLALAIVIARHLHLFFLGLLWVGRAVTRTMPLTSDCGIFCADSSFFAHSA